MADDSQSHNNTGIKGTSSLLSLSFATMSVILFILFVIIFLIYISKDNFSKLQKQLNIEYESIGMDTLDILKSTISSEIKNKEFTNLSKKFQQLTKTNLNIKEIYITNDLGKIISHSNKKSKIYKVKLPTSKVKKNTIIARPNELPNKTLTQRLTKLFLEKQAVSFNFLTPIKNNEEYYFLHLLQTRNSIISVANQWINNLYIQIIIAIGFSLIFFILIFLRILFSIKLFKKKYNQIIANKMRLSYLEKNIDKTQSSINTNPKYPKIDKELTNQKKTDFKNSKVIDAIIID